VLDVAGRAVQEWSANGPVDQAGVPRRNRPPRHCCPALMPGTWRKSCALVAGDLMSSPAITTQPTPRSGSPRTPWPPTGCAYCASPTTPGISSVSSHRADLLRCTCEPTGSSKRHRPAIDTTSTAPWPRPCEAAPGQRRGPRRHSSPCRARSTCTAQPSTPHAPRITSAGVIRRHNHSPVRHRRRR